MQITTNSTARGGQRPSGRAVLALVATAAAAFMLLLGVQRSQAAVSDGQAEAAAAAGAAWFADEQSSSGALAGDWGMTALAASGTNPADVRTSLIDPSAQDFYVGDWTANGPGGVATDFERAVLAGSAGGIQTSRVAANRNMVAQIAGFWDGTQVGSTGLLNDDIFGVLALQRVDAPDPLLGEIADHIRTKQMADGGWSWSNSVSAISDTDVTGAVVGALCAAGADPQADPAIQKALGYLHSVQDEATGGFAAPPWTPVNTNSTGWVASGLIACGIDPQSVQWVTSAGKTPFDYLLSMQRPDGRFCWNDVSSCEGSAAYATWDAVRPLVGETWSAPAPERVDPTEPSIRPAPAVASGTAVPLALVIDYGNGEVDMCRIKVDSGSDLGATLAAAQTSASPKGCVTASAVSEGAGGETLEQLNGVVPAAGSEWVVSIDGAPEAAVTSDPVGFGDLVAVRLDGEARGPIETPVLKPGGDPPAELRARKVKLGGLERVKLRSRAIKPRVTCPAGLGPEGCVGTLTIRFRQAGKARTGGQAAFALSSGASRKFVVEVRPRLRHLVAASGRLDAWLVARTRAADGAARFTRTGLTLIAPPARGD